MSFDNGRWVQMCYGSLIAAQGHHVSEYRCYLMSGQSIQAVRTYECTNDAEVILKASALLDSKPEHPTAEIWQDRHLVARLARNPTGETPQQDNVIRVVKQDG
jgi:hypothetical protein